MNLQGWFEGRRRRVFGAGVLALMIALTGAGCGGGGGGPNGTKPDGGADTGTPEDGSMPGDDGSMPMGDGSVVIPDGGLPLGDEFGEVTGDDEFLSSTPINNVMPNTVQCDDITYESKGLTIAGQVCRPKAGDNFPILIVNHGLGAYKASHAPQYAAKGYAVFESAYRGETPSQGLRDYCSDEVYDVRRMIQIAKAQDYVDNTRIAMVGYSHGGCITMKTLLAEHLAGTTEFDAVVDVFGPSDWGAVYLWIRDFFVPNISVGDCSNILVKNTPPCLTLADVSRATGGSPSQVPDAYGERSPVNYASLYSDIDTPLLIVHGSGDNTVPMKGQCDFVKALGGFDAWHVNGNGTTTTDVPQTINLLGGGAVIASCSGAGLTWKSGTAPTNTYSAERTFVVYDTAYPLGHAEDQGAGLNMQGRAEAFLANKFAP